MNRAPSAYQPNALPLGQTGSQIWLWFALLLDCKDLEDKNPQVFAAVWERDERNARNVSGKHKTKLFIDCCVRVINLSQFTQASTQRSILIDEKKKAIFLDRRQWGGKGND